MDLREILRRYFLFSGNDEVMKQYEQFFHGCSDEEFSLCLTEHVLSNVDLKHRLAKEIVAKIKDEGDSCRFKWNMLDERLMCFVAYYVAKEILNSPMSVEQAQSMLSCSVGEGRVDKGSYLKGLTLASDEIHMPVRMRPGGDMHQGYRNFIINLLCFNTPKFLMGCRCDSGPIYSMKYHKGCSPIGIQEAMNGDRWTVFQVDQSLTDDFTAVFSNGLDGDGTVEVCDWINEGVQRVLFRSNY